jgi:small-conductance mechanosensitive channel
MISISQFFPQYAVLGQQVFGNTVEQYVAAFVAFCVVYLALRFIKFVVVQHLRKITEKTATDIDDLAVHILGSIRSPFFITVSLAIGTQFLEGPAILKTVVVYAAVAVALYRIVRGIQQIIEYTFQKGIRKRLEEDPRFDASIVRLLSGLAKGSVWLIAALLVAQNLGYDITALIAGLGIGGLAIAFALQNVLSDMFASFSIYLDKPFQTGDFIIVGDVMGTVKHIGIKSTRLQSLWGEEIIMPNKDLTEARVKNYKRMEDRRIVFSFGVTYETPSAKLRMVPDIVKEIIEGLELAELNRVHWKEFGDSALMFEVMYQVKTKEFNTYMDIQQEMNLQLKDRLEKQGMAFAYPTQTLYVHKEK